MSYQEEELNDMEIKLNPILPQVQEINLSLNLPELTKISQREFHNLKEYIQRLHKDRIQVQVQGLILHHQIIMEAAVHHPVLQEEIKIQRNPYEI
jgi:Mlc titration factor MtfA (ptsG expression regulator)